MRWLRLLARLPFLAVHLGLSLPLVVLLLVLPGTRRIAWGGEDLHARLIRAWSGGLLRVFGLRVRRYGTPLRGAVLFVANHVSWIDIELFHSQLWAGFVSKAEVEKWPLVGWLATLGGTIYHHRGNQDSLHGVMHQMVQRLQEGRPVAVFPEGRTTSGEALGVFHARIFQPAVVANVPAQPVALRYGAGGEAQRIVAFAPGESFMGNFLRLLGEPGRVAEVHFLDPVPPSEDGRRRMAETCRERIAAVLAR
ncbi:MAG: lysophospholipid acyltransferase family protein [Silanimonas lenta]